MTPNPSQTTSEPLPQVLGSPSFVELQRLQFGDSFVWDGRLWTLIDRDIDSGNDDCYIAREHHYGLTCPGAHDQFCRFPTTVSVRFVERFVPHWANDQTLPTEGAAQNS